MSAILEDLKIAYFSVPKVGSTTLKTFFYEVQHPLRARLRSLIGRTVEGEAHAAYNSRTFEEMAGRVPGDFWKFCVVRSPVDRVVSCYRNRVLHTKCLENRDFKQANQDGALSAEPSLEEFVDRLAEYCERSRVVQHHCRPLAHYLGGDAGYYDRVFGIREMDALHDELARRIGGRVPAFQRLQTGGPNIKSSDLDAERTARLKQVYEDDFTIYGDRL